MKKTFSVSAINKTISLIDKYFAYDEANRTNNSFVASIFDDGVHKYVSFKPVDYEWRKQRYFSFYYDNNGKSYHKVIKTYADLNDLNKLIKVMF